MLSYNSNDLRAGMKILLDGDPCAIIECEFIKPGKGQAFTRVKYRNLHSGRTLERSFRSSESVTGAEVTEEDASFLYEDGDRWYFMSTADYEQYAVSAKIVGDVARWLVPEAVCQLTIYQGEPLGVIPPNFIEIEVIYTEPGVKGDTATGGSKPAQIQGGAQVDVPLFVGVGEIIRVDTRTGEYVSRVKN